MHRLTARGGGASGRLRLRFGTLEEISPAGRASPSPAFQPTPSQPRGSSTSPPLRLSTFPPFRLSALLCPSPRRRGTLFPPARREALFVGIGAGISLARARTLASFWSLPCPAHSYAMKRIDEVSRNAGDSSTGSVMQHVPRVGLLAGIVSSWQAARNRRAVEAPACAGPSRTTSASSTPSRSRSG